MDSEANRPGSGSEEGGSKKRRVDGEEDGIISKDNISGVDQLFPGVLKLVAESNFLTTEELGRLLLRTSKSMTASAFDDQGDENSSDGVWKCLCLNQWGVDGTAVLLESTGFSPEVCFRKLAARERYSFTGPRALQYAPSDYLVILSVYEGYDWRSGRPMFCKTVRGDEVPNLFRKGEAEIVFDKPLWKHVLEAKDERVNFIWLAKVQLLRLPDQRVVDLGESIGWERIRHSVDVDGPCGGWSRGSASWSLQFNATRYYVRSLIGLYCQGYDSIGVHVGLNYRVTSTNTESDTIGIFDIRINVSFADSHANDPELVPVSDFRSIKDGSVTFAHFLEALDSWNA